MILGSYPCCGAALAIPLSTDHHLPAYVHEPCPKCGAKVWHYLTRIEPKSWTGTDFLREHAVHEASGTIIPTPERAAEIAEAERLYLAERPHLRTA